jgi:hypothetical protein
MPAKIQYTDIVSQDVEDNLKKLNEMLLSTDKIIKGIKVSGNTGQDLQKIVDGLEKVVKLEDQYQKVTKKRTDIEKKLSREEKQKQKRAEKFNLILQQRKAKENALVNEIRKRAREEENLKREMKELLILNQKEVKSDQELIRLNVLLAKKRRNMVVVTRQQRKEYNRLTVQIAKNEKQIRKTDASIGRFQRNVGNYASSFRGMLGALGFAGGAFMVVRAFKQMAEIFKGFEKDLSRLQAIIGSDVNITNLEIQAKSLGSTTVFTARQIVALQTELAKLGFSVTQIESATKGIQGLAAATGIELADAATIAGSTLNIFDLQMSESTRVSDVLAKSTTESALDMEKLSTALPIVGTTAKIANQSLERTTAFLGVLSDRGMDASTSATALRNIFLKLSKQGITMEEAFAKINAATDKNAESMRIFGIRSAGAGVILAENTEAVNELETALIGAEGAAQDMADTMLDNLAGDITLAESAWEGLVLSIEDGDGVISTAIRSIVQAFTGLLNVLIEVNKRGSLGSAALAASEDHKKAAESFQEVIDGIFKGVEGLKSVQGEWAERFLTTQEKNNIIQDRFKSLISATKKEFEEYNELSKDDFRWTSERIEAQTRLEMLNTQYLAWIETLNPKQKEKNKNDKEEVEILKEKQKLLSERAFREGMGLEGGKFSLSRITLGGTLPEIKEEFNEMIPEAIDHAVKVVGKEYTRFQNFVMALKTRQLNKWVSNLFGVTEEELDQVKSQLITVFNQAMNLWQQHLNNQRSINDELLSMTEERIQATQDELEAEQEALNKAAEAGQAYDDTILKSLEARLEAEEQAKVEALAKDKELKQKQKQLDIVSATIAAASGVANALKLTPVWLAIAMAAVMASLGAVQVAQIARAEYADGTRYLELGGNPDGTDTIPIMADKGERILSRKQNAKIDRDFPNELIPDAIQFYKDEKSGTPILNIWNDKLLEGIYENTKDKGQVYRNGILIQETNNNIRDFY